MSLYDDTIQTPEYQAFIKRINGFITSSPFQQKRCTIQISSPKDGIWVFYENGIVRTNLNSDRLGKVSNAPRDWPDYPTVKDMVELLKSANSRLDKREESKNSQYERINTDKKLQVILLYILFDIDRLQFFASYDNEWIDLESDRAEYIQKMDFERFIKNFALTKTTKAYRIK